MSTNRVVIDPSLPLIPIDSLNLSPIICDVLKNAFKISTFFAVQQQVIPAILCGHLWGSWGDVCVSAPTGSGKTLAYVLPIVQSLSERVVPHLRALVLVPTRELAEQALSVFEPFCKALGLRLEGAVGAHPFPREQERILGGPFLDEVDILVATPGRLVDHLTHTPGFSLHHLQFLVVDEADRLLGQAYYGWTEALHKALLPQHDPHIAAGTPGASDPEATATTAIRTEPPLGSDDYLGWAIPPRDLSVCPIGSGHATIPDFDPPLRKLLFSATLTSNPQKLARLRLRAPLVFTASAAKHYALPATLKEHMVVCTAGEKPLALLHLLRSVFPQAAPRATITPVESTATPLPTISTPPAAAVMQVLCFTKSIEAAHRLHRLLQLFGVPSAEFNSQLTRDERQDIAKRLREGALSVVVSSDAMARGIDVGVGGVTHVVNYDVPSFITTYVHRAGRTARAGKEGSVYTLLRKEEVFHFKEILKKADQRKKPAEVKLKRTHFEPLVARYERALEALGALVSSERRGELKPTDPVDALPPDAASAGVPATHPESAAAPGVPAADQLIEADEAAGEEEVEEPEEQETPAPEIVKEAGQDEEEEEEDEEEEKELTMAEEMERQLAEAKEDITGGDADGADQ
ncbi:putative ATP-dependent RNA helicase DDX51 [Paratrimastix pyriformis]|uniref:ATP-dependent RNA helicase DDX51 n=1 Tax=Paratrimastix pyriformis TaxID=342808 RepID=A0ABQ8UEL2_9EUKA|nr:putative ATP-dependent RNA helicase DDX51 [Paratrimastix pyriformis]